MSGSLHMLMLDYELRHGTAVETPAADAEQMARPLRML